MNEKTFRNQVTWMTFLFSLLVIWIHSFNLELFSGAAGPLLDLARSTEDLLGNIVGQIAVPGFFMLSAYLFFRNFPEKNGSVSGFEASAVPETASRTKALKKRKFTDLILKKWKSRAGSILIPYLAWNVLYYLGYALIPRLPLVRGIIGKTPADLGLSELASAVLHYTYAPIFWYLYQLILLIVLSPLLYLILKRTCVGMIWLAVVLLSVAVGFDTQTPNTDALFYYSAAAFASLRAKRWAELPFGAFRFGIGGVLAAIAGCGLFVFMRVNANVVWLVGFRAAAPAALWFLLPLGRWETRAFMRQSLFLYATHYITVRFTGKAAALFFGRFADGSVQAAAALLTFLLMPAAAVVVSYALALFLSRYAAPVWRVLSGGREL